MSSRRERRQGRWTRTAGLLGPLAEDGLQQLRAQWRQHALTLVGLVWGAAAVVLLLSFGTGFFAFLDVGFKKTGDRYTFVGGEYTSSESGGQRPGRRIEFTRDDFERLRASVPSARLVAAELQAGSSSVRTSYRTKTTAVSASTPDIRLIKQLRVARGRFYDEVDDREGRAVAVLGANLPAVFFGAEDPLGRTIQVQGRPFRVIGVLERKGFQIVVNNALHDDMLFIPLGAGQRALGVGDRVGGLIAEPARLDRVDAMHAEIHALLWPRHRIQPDDEQAIRVESITEFLRPITNIAIGLQLLLGLVGTGTLAMAGVGVANLMIAIVNGRRLELAMRRACGARRSDVTLELLVETLVVVMTGGALGIGLALALVWGVAALPLPEMVPVPRVSSSVLATTLLVLLATGLAAGVAPARTASRVDPAAALRVT